MSPTKSPLSKHDKVDRKSLVEISIYITEWIESVIKKFRQTIYEIFLWNLLKQNEEKLDWMNQWINESLASVDIF